jgi:ribonucleoside-triphosphate reductase
MQDHGYISGEHFICPECGEEAEVYSRITGYYRPVKNWNEGKTQEFKDRKVYNIEKSDIKPAVDSPLQDRELLLFTTPTCANCAMTKKALSEAGIAYRAIDASKHQDLVKKYGVLQAPTLVAHTDNGTEKFAGLVSVQEYISSNNM